MNARDKNLSRELGLKCDEARAALEKHMTERGLREEDGWWIYECTRQANGYTELVMRPMHRKLTPPSDLECVCIIDESDGETAAECRE